MGKAQAKNKKATPGQENILNLIVTEDNVDACGNKEQMREVAAKVRREHEVLQRHLGPLDEHGRTTSPNAERPPMFKAPIPKNAQKPKYNCVGFMGGGTGVADPRKFVKAKSGGLGPTVLKGNVTKPGEKAKKWTRPLDPNFKPKMGKPNVAPPKKSGEKEMEEKIPKRDFMKDNKASAVKVVVKNKAVVPKKLELGKTPAYLEKRRAREKFEFHQAETERIERRKERKDRRRLRRKERQDLLVALQGRRDLCVNALTRAEIGGGREKQRKKLEIEISWLDKDIARLESWAKGSGVVVVEGN